MIPIKYVQKAQYDCSHLYVITVVIKQFASLRWQYRKTENTLM